MSEKINYDEKQEKWLASPDLEFTNIDNNSSIKTNFLFTERNFTNLKKWLSDFKSYVRYLRSLIDIDNILSELLDKLKREKTTIPVLYSMEIGQITTYTDSITKKSYRIKRVTEYNIEITSLSEDNWYVDRLMVCVKNYDGTIVYPVIKTISSSINIYFTDGLSTNYNVMFI
jgi:hypothetical protein